MVLQNTRSDTGPTPGHRRSKLGDELSRARRFGPARSHGAASWGRRLRNWRSPPAGRDASATARRSAAGFSDGARMGRDSAVTELVEMARWRRRWWRRNARMSESAARRSVFSPHTHTPPSPLPPTSSCAHWTGCGHGRGMVRRGPRAGPHRPRPPPPILVCVRARTCGRVRTYRQFANPPTLTPKPTKKRAHAR